MQHVHELHRETVAAFESVPVKNSDATRRHFSPKRSILYMLRLTTSSKVYDRSTLLKTSALALHKSRAHFTQDVC